MAGPAVIVIAAMASMVTVTRRGVSSWTSLHSDRVRRCLRTGRTASPTPPIVAHVTSSPLLLPAMSQAVDVPLEVTDVLSTQHGYPDTLFVESGVARGADYQCSICMQVSRDVVSHHQCGHRYCRQCIQRLFNTQNNTCPSCRVPSTVSDYSTDPHAQRMIRGTSVICPYGCAQAGLVIGVDERTLISHLTTSCLRRVIHCPRRCGRAYLAQHSNEHDRRCIKDLVPCPYQCFELSQQRTPEVRYLDDGNLEYVWTLRYFFSAAGDPSRVFTHVARSRLHTHINTLCPNVVGSCGACNTTLPRHAWDQHVISLPHQMTRTGIRVTLIARYLQELLLNLGDTATAATVQAAMNDIDNETFTRASRATQQTHDLLARIVAAQESLYSRVLQELRRGKKQSHWIWIIFPIAASPLYNSRNHQSFAIPSDDAAREYIAHPVLGPRLRECTEAVLQSGTTGVTAVFGELDANKFGLCMDLFARATGEAVFKRALAKYFV